MDMVGLRLKNDMLMTKNMINCHRCGELMREATNMDYGFNEIKQMKIQELNPIPYKIYMVCDQCYLGHWYDSRDLE